MEKLVNVRLYGKLGARFGRTHHLAVKNPAEAVKALCVILDGFEQYLQHAKKHGMVFAVFRGKRNIDADDMAIGSGDSDIRIAPIIEGSKKAGAFQTILGAVLVVVGVAIAYFSGGTLAAFGAGLAKFGALLAAGGAVQMLSPQSSGLSSRQDADNKPSYAFGGAVNTTAMGNPVAVLYGEREIGGAIISAGILAEDI